MQDFSALIESEHVVKIYWALWYPTYQAYQRDNIECYTEKFEISHLSKYLEVKDNTYLMRYVEDEQDRGDPVFVLEGCVFNNVHEGSVVPAAETETQREIQDEH